MDVRLIVPNGDKNKAAGQARAREAAGGARRDVGGAAPDGAAMPAVGRLADVTGIVLAGGRAQRMGGIDKGLVRYGKTTLVQTVVDRLAQQCATLVISANRNRDIYARLGWPVVADKMTGFNGPLAGIAAALETVRTPFALVAPCDSPKLPDDYAARLRHAFDEDASLLCAAALAQGVKEPVYMMVRQTALAGIEDFLSSGRRAVHVWVETAGVRWVPFDDLAAFDNFNTLADLQAEEQRQG